MGLVVFGLIRFLRQLRPAGRFFELGRDRGSGRPVRVSRRRAKLVIVHLLIRQGLQIGQFAPCPHGAALHRAPLVKVDDLHRCISGRLREGAEVNGPLGGIVAVILRWLPAPGALLHLKQLFVIINALSEVLFRYLAVAVIMAPIIVPLAVLRFGKLPCDKGTRGCLVIAQGKAPAIVEGGGLQNLIALVDFYVVSSFPASGQVGPKCMNVTKYPVKPGRKVLGYSGPENRRKKSRNTGLFLRANRNRSIRFSAAFFSCAPGFFCGFPRPYRCRNSRLAAPPGERASRKRRTAGYPGPGRPRRWKPSAPGQGEERPPGSSGSRLPSSISPAYSTHSPAAGSHTPGHSWRTSP